MWAAAMGAAAVPTVSPSRGGCSDAHHTGSLSTLLLGTSGYVYRHWRGGVFYPAGLRHLEELAWYAGRFRTVELNNPFYRLPEASTFRRWREAVPDDFRFAVKASRFITHVKRLNDPAEPLRLLLERAAALEDALGPILFQLPPTLQLDLVRLAAFLGALPDGPQWTIEFRHPSWQRDDVYDLLGRRGVALCVPVGGRVQPDMVTTAPFAYLRMHAGAAPGGGFTDDQLRAWAGRVRGLRRGGKQVYIYFNNDWEGHAVRDAARLRALLGVER